MFVCFSGTQTYSVEAVQGGVAKMPCDLEAPDGDKLTIVIWFKYINNRKMPIYSYVSNNNQK